MGSDGGCGCHGERCCSTKAVAKIIAIGAVAIVFGKTAVLV